MGLSAPRRGVLALCFSLLCQLLTPRSPNRPSTPVKMPTPTRCIPPLSPFPLLFLLTQISHRLKRPLSPCLSLFLWSNFVLLPFVICFSSLPCFVVCPPFIPSHLPIETSQSEQQSPQPCKATQSQTVVPVETYSKRLLFFSAVPVTEMRHGNQPLLENTPCLLLPAQQTHHLEQTAELPWSRWRSSDGRSAVLQYVSTRKLTALWKRNLHSSVSEQHPRNVQND